jgi:hypothetical protein
MFRRNQKHLQMPMFSTVNSLPDAQRKCLDESWAGVFYREFFCRLDEEPFKALYCDEPSRPNVPVNRLVGFEVLKAGFGWSDEEMYEAYLFNVQVRYALGLYDLGEDSFDLRTIYYFRERLSEHMQKTGENLIEKAFEQVTDAQIAAFRLKTGRLRMDSTFVSSNIRQMTRLHLLVEMLQRVHRMLAASDRQRYAAEFAPYIQGTAGQFMYHLRGQEIAPHIEQVGVLMARLVAELCATHGAETTYLLLDRVFHEHFVVEQSRVRVKAGSDLNAKTLQSPDDPEATYRKKGTERHYGYVSNVTETCDPKNQLQLIVAVHTEKNVTDDSALLVADLPSLKERTDVHELTTDGGYMSDASRRAMAAHHVRHVLTSLRGAQPGAVSLGTFAITQEADGRPATITCPLQQTAPLMSTHPNRYRADFDLQACAECPQAQRCAARVLQRRPVRALYLRQRDIESALQQRAFLLQDTHNAPNLRVAIEGTISALKRPFAEGQLPVRGLCRVAPMMVAAAAMANVRRIQRHLRAHVAEQAQQAGANDASVTPSSLVSLFAHALGQLLARFFTPRRPLCRQY